MLPELKTIRQQPLQQESKLVYRRVAFRLRG